MGADPPTGANRPPGYDDEDPYEGEDLSTYPEWWRRNIEEFEAHGLRCYRPPRFEDGELTPPVIDELERELGCDIRLRALDPAEGDEWEVLKDGEPIATIGRRRTGDAYTLYLLDSETFASIVRNG